MDYFSTFRAFSVGDATQKLTSSVNVIKSGHQMFVLLTSCVQVLNRGHRIISFHPRGTANIQTKINANLFFEVIFAPDQSVTDGPNN